MALEDAAEADLPFGGSVNLTNPMTVLTTVIALTFGFALWSLASGMGDQVASWAAGVLQSLTGTNPTTGGNSNPDIV